MTAPVGGPTAESLATAVAVAGSGSDPIEVICSSRGLGWPDIEVARVRLRESRLDLPPRTCHLVIVHLGRPTTVRVGLGRLLRPVRTAPGAISIVPAGVAAAWSFDAPGADDLHLLLDPTVVAGVVARGGVAVPGATDIRERLGVPDPAIEQVGRDILREVETPGPAGEVVAAALADLLAAHLVRRHSAAATALEPLGRTDVSEAVLRRVVEHIDRNLAADLTVGALAAVVGLSRDHFGRLFRRAVGRTPHEFVVRRRVERAKELLRGGGGSIAEVALAVGFADQGHLTRHFGRLLGTTPARFLREHGILQRPSAFLQDQAG